MNQKLKSYLRAIKYSWVPIPDMYTLERCLEIMGRRQVLYGPFKGMAYVDTSYGSAYYPKIFGTYEKELQQLWDVEWLQRFSCIADIGCAEGYYLAGIAYLLSKRPQERKTKLVGYDIDTDALAKAAQLLNDNGIHNIDLKTSGIETDFAGVTLPALLICDIEGAEREILDSTRIPCLAKMHILVEVHDEPGSMSMHDLMMMRFSLSHTITEYHFCERTLNDFPRLVWPRISDKVQMNLMAENRKYGKNWLLMVPKT